MNAKLLQGETGSLADKKKPFIHIVDDDEPVRDATKLLLESLGYAVQAFSSATNYLESEKAGASDCRVLDFHMPRVSGIELLELLRARKVETGDYHDGQRCARHRYLCIIPRYSTRIFAQVKSRTVDSRSE